MNKQQSLGTLAIGLAALGNLLLGTFNDVSAQVIQINIPFGSTKHEYQGIVHDPRNGAPAAHFFDGYKDVYGPCENGGISENAKQELKKLGIKRREIKRGIEDCAPY